MRSLRFHKYLPLACIVFFINSLVFFPRGLLITTILSPGFYIWLLLRRQRYVLETFFAAMFPFAFASLVTGMQKLYFLTSFGLLITCYVTVYAFAVAIQETDHLDDVFRTLIWLNLAFAFVGLLLRFTSLAPIVWQMPGDVDNPANMMRFKGLTYEPSHYGTLLAPLVLYSCWLHIQKRTYRTLGLLAATVGPLLMSLSFGAIGLVILSVFVVQFKRYRTEARFRWVFVATTVLVLGYLALPSTSGVKLRINNLFTGNDPSANVRTSMAFESAYAMAKSKDIWFGIGFGQQKVIGSYFLAPNQRVIPSAVAGTLEEMGLVGVALRFGVIFYFFFKTRPDRDPYRLSMFIWVFLFQFGASYKDNLAEYMVWIFAFSPSVGFFSAKQPEPAEGEPSYAVPQLT